MATPTPDGTSESITLRTVIQIREFTKGNIEPDSAIFFHNNSVPFCTVFVIPVCRRNPEFVSVRVTRCSFYPRFYPGVVYQSLGWTVSVVDADGAEKFLSYFGYEDFQSLEWVEDFFSDRGYELEQFVRRSVLFDDPERFLPGGVLTVRVEMFYEYRVTDENVAKKNFMEANIHAFVVHPFLKQQVVEKIQREDSTGSNPKDEEPEKNLNSIGSDSNEEEPKKDVDLLYSNPKNEKPGKDDDYNSKNVEHGKSVDSNPKDEEPGKDVDFIDPVPKDDKHEKNVDSIAGGSQELKMFFQNHTLKERDHWTTESVLMMGESLEFIREAFELYAKLHQVKKISERSHHQPFHPAGTNFCRDLFEDMDLFRRLYTDIGFQTPMERDFVSWLKKPFGVFELSLQVTRILAVQKHLQMHWKNCREEYRIASENPLERSITPGEDDAHKCSLREGIRELFFIFEETSKEDRDLLICVSRFLKVFLNVVRVLSIHLFWPFCVLHLEEVYHSRNSQKDEGTNDIDQFCVNPSTISSNSTSRITGEHENWVKSDASISVNYDPVVASTEKTDSVDKEAPVATKLDLVVSSTDKMASLVSEEVSKDVPSPPVLAGLKDNTASVAEVSVKVQSDPVGFASAHKISSVEEVSVLVKSNPAYAASSTYRTVLVAEEDSAEVISDPFVASTDKISSNVEEVSVPVKSTSVTTATESITSVAEEVSIQVKYNTDMASSANEIASVYDESGSSGIWYFTIQTSDQKRFQIPFQTGKSTLGSLLRSASPVFDRMLETPMAEKSNRFLKIDEFDSSTFSRFLSYVESGGRVDVDSLQECLDLYQLAHKYQVDKLVLDCAEKFKHLMVHDFMGVEQFAEFSKFYGDDTLMTTVEYFRFLPRAMFAFWGLADDLLDLLSPDTTWARTIKDEPVFDKLKEGTVVQIQKEKYDFYE